MQGWQRRQGGGATSHLTNKLALILVVGVLALAPTQAANAAGETEALINDARNWLARFTGSDEGDWYLERNLAGFRAYPLLDRTQRRMNRGEYERARQSLDRALRVAPRNAPAWAISADLAYREGDIETAWHQINHALALNPGLAQAMVYRGYIRLEYSDFDGAQLDFNNALATGRLTGDQAALARNGLGAADDQLNLLNQASRRSGRHPISQALLNADPSRRPQLPDPGPVILPTATSADQSYSEPYVQTYAEPYVAPPPSAGDRAYDLAARGQCAAADPLFQAGFRETGDAGLLIARADCFNAAGNTVAAQSAYDVARLEGGTMSVAQEVYVLQSLAYIREANEDYAGAGELWSSVIELEEAPSHRLSLARNRIAAENTMGAARALAPINPEILSTSEQALFYDLRGSLRAESDPVNAIPDLEAAVRLGDTADRRFKLAVALQAAERHDEALTHLLAAYEMDPGSADLALALAYAYGNVDQHEASIPYFVEGLRRNDAEFFEAREDLAYAQLRTRRYRDASQSFRQVRDNEPRYADDTRAERRDLAERMYRVRSEVRNLDRTWYAYGSANYRSADINTSGLPGADRDQSQWSALIGWYPLRGRIPAGRNVSLFARAYQSFEPGSFDLRDESLQAGVGLRIQPFNDFGLSFAAERLIAVGEDSRNAWLLSAAHGWGVGGDWRPTESNWTVARTYIEAAYIPDDPQLFTGFGEAYLGQAIRLAPRLAVVPHVVASARYSEDDFAENFLTEVGLGATFRYWFDDTRYQSPRGTIDFDLQYRWFAYDDLEVPLEEDGAFMGRITIAR